MKNNSSMTPFGLIAAILFGVGLFAMPALGGCAPTDIKWTEEVKLHDGKVIQLKRRTELTSSGFPVQKRGFNKYHQFCYVPMHIYWKSNPQYWPEVFDIVDGKAYAKVSLGSCSSCELHGYPDTDALYFVWADGAWKKIDYKEFPAQLRLNLLMNPFGRNSAEDAHGLVSLAEKENRDASTSYSLKVTGARGVNELPDIKGLCNKCKAITGRKSEIPDVFMPSSRTDCN